MGHFDQFPPTSPSVGCRFGQGTFAGTPATGETPQKRPFFSGLNCQTLWAGHQTMLRQRRKLKLLQLR
jgi:hypothetical protein